MLKGILMFFLIEAGKGILHLIYGKKGMELRKMQGKESNWGPYLWSLILLLWLLCVFLTWLFGEKKLPGILNGIAATASLPLFIMIVAIIVRKAVNKEYEEYMNNLLRKETITEENNEEMAVCANCHNSYIPDDKYCRFCGAPNGKPEFIPQYFEELYGPPPIRRAHQCPSCGFNWTEESMVDNEKWCPNCGSAVSIEEVDD